MASRAEPQVRPLPSRELGRREASSAFVFAFLAVMAAVAVKLLLAPLAAFDRPFLLLSGAVIVSAWYAGARAGIPATLFGVAAATFFSLGAGGLGAAEPGLFWAVALYLGEGLLISGLFEHARESRQSAEQRLDEAARELAELRASDSAGQGLAQALGVLGRVGSALGAELDPLQVAMLGADGALAISGAGSAALYFDRDGSEPIRVALGDVTRELAPDGERLRDVVRSSPVLRCGEAEKDPLLSRLVGQPGFASVLLARIDARSGRGVLCLGAPRPHAFVEWHERLLGVLAVQVGAAFDSAHHHADAQQAFEQAQAAARVKDEFLSTLSHELRTPLNAIMGWAHLLRGRQLGADDTHRAIETIVRNASLQESMIGELLDMSSLLNGRLRLEVAPLDLRDVVQDAVETGRSYARSRGVELQLTLPVSAVAVFGDGIRLQQIVWSLVSNAIKFTPSGGRATVSVDGSGAEAAVVVSDTGAGLDPNLRRRLFSRFSRADASSTRPTRGLGLGLAVARGLAELHGGQLAADSPGPGQGSTFTLRLPHYRQHAEPPQRPLPHEPGAAIGGGTAA